MNTTRRLYFPIHIFVLTILLVFQSSCGKKSKKDITKTKDFTVINKLLANGYKHFQDEETDSAYYYFNKAKNAAEIKNDTSRIINSLSWMAQIQRHQGDYVGSEATAVEALPFIENTDKYPNGKWNIYNQLGNNYLCTLYFDNALYYFNKALLLKTDPIEKAGMKNNIALTYMAQNKYQDAIKILSPLTLKKDFIEDPEAYSRVLDNLGYCYSQTGNAKAIDYLYQSVKIRAQEKNERGLIGSYYHLSQFYKKNNLNLATHYANLGYEKATKLNSVDDRLECLELLIQNSSGNKSKEYSLIYLHINDSINKIRQKAKNQFAKIKYDSTKEKDENLKLKTQKAENALQLELQKNKTLLLYFIVVIIIAIAGFSYYYLIAKSKREKVKTSYDTEIRISKKLHDELANDVFQAMAFAETQDLSTSQNKEILLNNLDTIYSRTRNISKENSIVETGTYFLSNLKEMISGFNTDTTQIITNGLDSVNWPTIEKTKKITLYRVLQELLVNMKKHSNSSLVVLSFNLNENKIHLNYTDNGVGVPFNKINLKNGLKNVENRIHAIKGTVTFDTKSDKGFKVQITFPS
ncbi:ATP-binding protein [uncultured Flavobacterium sp.]|uniref:tetratricopeptide repeat-containing sensor histidine kinase n=1 Tax=uncultured Flavobacterium sp. TaxID=165435 RepID=UPI0030EF9500